MSEQELEIKTDSAIIDDFSNFIKQYHFPQIESLIYTDTPIFHLDYNSLVSKEGTEYLCDLLHEEADKALSCIQQAVKSIISEINPDVDTDKLDIPVRLSNWDEKRLLRDINASLEGKLITFDCIVTHSSEKRPFLSSSVYVCTSCDAKIPSIKNQYVKSCPSCDEKRLVLHKKKSKFTDSRNINVQELPEDLPAGNLPSKNLLKIYGTDLTKSDRCRPGTRITVTSIVRFDYDTSTMSDLKTHDPLGLVENFGVSLKLVLEANNIEKIDATKDLYNLTKEDIEKIEKLKMDIPLLEKTLVKSFAPHVYGHTILKEAILLMLVGCASFSASVTQQSNKKYIPNRGDIHLLMVGSPGVAKSKLLEFTSLIAPRVIRTTGGGSTAAGLTAAVVPDQGGRMMLEAGAVVLGDLGLTIIDEFDKMKSEDRSRLHEAMEQQTVSINKGGIAATLNARTSILAASNPVYGHYDLFKTLAENTDLPTPIISRFDLIFALPDVVNEETDRAIAQTMLKQRKGSKSIYSQDPEQEDKTFPVDFLAKYVYYVKNHSGEIPALSNGAEKLIEDQYSYLRQFAEKEKGMNVAKTITVTPRIVDALYRLSVARARLLLKTEVDERDVQRSIFLINEMYKSFGIDIESGNSNLTLLYGAPLAKKNKQTIFLEVCNSISENGESDMGSDTLIEDLVKTGRFTEMEARSTIKLAAQEGILEHRRGNVYAFNKDVLRQ